MSVRLLLTALLIGLVLAGLAIGVRFLIAVSRGRDPQTASRLTTRNAVTVVGAALSLLTMAMTALAEIGGGAWSWISMHPFAASNGALGFFGAVSSWAGIGVEPWQWVAAAIIIPGAVLLIYELGEADA